MKKMIFVILACLWYLPAAVTQGQRPNAIELSVIVHKDNPIEKLSITEVRNYWMRRGAQKAWPALKTSVMPVDRKGASNEKGMFYKKVVGLAEADVEAYFAAKQYQSAESPPVKMGSDREVIEYVSANKGALGFVNSATLSAEDRQAVKVVCAVAD